MGLELIHVERIRIAEESAGSANFAQELSGSIGSFVDLRYNSATAGINREMLRDNRTVQRTYTEPLDVVGARAASLDIELDLTATGTDQADATGNPTSSDDGLNLLLKHCFGGFEGLEGTANLGASAAHTTTNLNVDEPSSQSYGSLLGVVMPDGGFEVAQVISVSGGGVGYDGRGISPELSAIPGNSEDFRGGSLFYLADDPNTSLQAIVEEADRDDLWWLLGLGMQSISFNFENRSLVSASVSLAGADYAHDDDVGTPLGGSALSVGTYSDDGPRPFVSSEVIFGAHATISADVRITRTVVDPSSISLNFNWAYEPQESFSGVNGISRWRIRPNRPTVTVEMTFPVESSNILTYENARKNRTQYGLQVQAGDAPGKTFGVIVPTMQITDVQRAESSGLHGVRVVAKAQDNVLPSTVSAEIARSPIIAYRM